MLAKNIQDLPLMVARWADLISQHYHHFDCYVLFILHWWFWPTCFSECEEEVIWLFLILRIPKVDQLKGCSMLGFESWMDRTIIPPFHFESNNQQIIKLFLLHFPEGNLLLTSFNLMIDHRIDVQYCTHKFWKSNAFYLRVNLFTSRNQKHINHMTLFDL